MITLLLSGTVIQADAQDCDKDRQSFNELIRSAQRATSIEANRTAAPVATDSLRALLATMERASACVVSRGRPPVNAIAESVSSRKTVKPTWGDTTWRLELLETDIEKGFANLLQRERLLLELTRLTDRLDDTGSRNAAEFAVGMLDGGTTQLGLVVREHRAPAFMALTVGLFAVSDRTGALGSAGVAAYVGVSKQGLRASIGAESRRFGYVIAAGGRVPFFEFVTAEALYSQRRGIGVRLGVPLGP